MRTGAALTLAGAIYAFVMVSALIGAGFSVVAMRNAMDRMSGRVMAEAVSVRSIGLLTALTRELSEEWLHMEAMADRLSLQEPSLVRAAMDLMVAEGAKVSWVGFAALDGTVTAASAGLLEGADVSERPWFRRGLEGAFAGDVHEALLLAKLLDPAGNDPPRFLDYALPVADAEGRPIGVLGMHINFDWAVRLVAEMSEALAIDAVLVSQDGTTIVSTIEADPGRPSLEPFRLAALGASEAVLAPWPDGGIYFSVVRPVQASGQTPNFGWRLIARVDAGAFRTIEAGLPTLLLPFVVGLVSVLAIATVLFVRVFAEPFARAAQSATAIADGADQFPFESWRTRELAQLSAAIARLQGKARAQLSGDQG
jgi:hypothetical protein